MFRLLCWFHKQPIVVVSLACNYLLFISLQEEERKKRQELEAIMEENNKKIEEAQRKLVSLLFMWVFF